MVVYIVFDVLFSYGGGTLKIIAICSGKGGVGKTTMSVSVARSLSQKYKVGLFDADLTGANCHKFLDIIENYGIENNDNCTIITPAKTKLDDSTIEFLSLALVSESFVNWRPDEYGQFVSQVLDHAKWNVDYLIIDTPPGTHSEVIESLKYADAVILVTLPAELSLLDVKRTVELLSNTGKPIAGQIVNMSHCICPRCGEKINIFNGDTHIEDIPIIDNIAILQDGLPNIDITQLEKSINNPVVLSTSEKSFKAKLLKAFLKRVGK